MQTNIYNCWLQYETEKLQNFFKREVNPISEIITFGNSRVLNTALNELKELIGPDDLNGIKIHNVDKEDMKGILISTKDDLKIDRIQYSQDLNKINEEGYVIETFKSAENVSGLLIMAKSDRGVLYGMYRFLKELHLKEIQELNIIESPKTRLRMINQWDNIDGSIERGYAGNSIFYENNKINVDSQRIKDYARLLASIGINAISINNVNVWERETYLITEEYLDDIKKINTIFNDYGIKIFLCVNYASPLSLGHLETADPLNEKVANWWRDKVEEIYNKIPTLGGFLIKADSEGRPGPFTYGRNHAEGANVIANALKPFDGVLIWRAFVYNHLQDWRDRNTDRARAAYDNFMPLDGLFKDNVIVQIKNGPMDFQVREPVSPLFGGMNKTNQILELQITQEYTGQQIDVCYLVPQWKEILDFDTYAHQEGSYVKNVTSEYIDNTGIAAVSNIGLDNNWTGHTLAQANIYGYGRLIWNPNIPSDVITNEWIKLTFGEDELVKKNIKFILNQSWSTYESYTAPLGVGWMVYPHSHYGPNIDGYEYTPWGTYHFADRKGIGVDRTKATGTKYTEQYFEPNQSIYENIETCPDELLLFFHHVPYTYKLKSGKTVIQHIYDTHFKGVEEVKEFIDKWLEIKGSISKEPFENVLERLNRQLENAKNWRDQINTYFLRKSGIKDEHNRKIYP